jgi:hypothetical protein
MKADRCALLAFIMTAGRWCTLEGEGKGAPLAGWRSVSPTKIFAHACMADTVEIFFAGILGIPQLPLCLHGYFSLPVQCALIGTFIIACLFISLSITRTNRRVHLCTQTYRR